MSSARIPGSLRRGVSGTARKPQPSAPKKEQLKQVGLFTAALLMASSPLSIAAAQGTLPPLSVETTQPKKKAKAAPAKSGEAAPPAPEAPAKGANPYANPDAPYNVEKSASGKLTEPLVNTPKSVTVVPEQVIEDKGAHDLRELARSVPGLTIGSAEGGNAFGADDRAAGPIRAHCSGGSTAARWSARRQR
jgi:catecholate siderophore receptor